MDIMSAPRTTRTGFAKRAELVFEALRDVPPTHLSEGLKVPYSKMVPKRSKNITKNLIKDVYTTNEPRLLVITGHLYFDYILSRMLEREQHNLSKRQSESFYAKLEFLNNLGRFDSDTYMCLTAINKLRNSFAHNIFYDLNAWDATAIPYVQRYTLTAPCRKDLLRIFNILVLRYAFLVEVVVLSTQHEWLYLERVPNA
jgi:hypothetical protein